MTFESERLRRNAREKRWHEDDGFKNYAHVQYEEAQKFAMAVYERAWGKIFHPEVYAIILDRVSSPLTYIWQAWDQLSLEDRAKWDPELRKRGLAEAQAISAKVRTILEKKQE